MQKECSCVKCCEIIDIDFSKIFENDQISCTKCKSISVFQKCIGCNNLYAKSLTSCRELCFMCLKKLFISRTGCEKSPTINALTRLYIENVELKEKVETLINDNKEIMAKLDFLIGAVETMPPVMGPQYMATLKKYE